MIRINSDQLNASQLQFLESREPFVLFAAGFGAGKSTALILKALILKAINGALPGLLIAQTYGALYTNIVDPMVGILERSLPEQLRPKIIDRYGGRPALAFPDGSKIHLRSAEKPKSYDGLSVAYVCGDEPRHWKKEAYDIAISRARLKEAKLIQCCFTSTPVMNWLADEFNTNKPNRRLIVCGTRENAHNLPEGYIAGLEQSYSKRLRRAVVDGEFTILEGAVYEDFDPNPQTSPWIVDYEPDKFRERRTYLWVDPGFRRSAWLFVHQTAKMEWTVFDELILDDRSDMDAVLRVNQRGWDIDEIWTDPAADNVQSLVGMDVLQALTKIKTRNTGRAIRCIVDPWRSIEWGVDKVRVLLGGSDLPRRLLFARRLVELERGKNRGVIRDLASLRYPEARDGKPVTNLPLKDGLTDHFGLDCVRYGVIGLWLTTDLRKLDPYLLRDRNPGYRQAA